MYEKFFLKSHTRESSQESEFMAIFAAEVQRRPEKQSPHRECCNHQGLQRMLFKNHYCSFSCRFLSHHVRKKCQTKYFTGNKDVGINQWSHPGRQRSRGPLRRGASAPRVEGVARQELTVSCTCSWWTPKGHTHVGTCTAVLHCYHASCVHVYMARHPLPHHELTCKDINNNSGYKSVFKIDFLENWNVLDKFVAASVAKYSVPFD